MTKINRELLMIVPVQYVSGVSATQTDSNEMVYFDQNPNTFGTLSIAGDCDLTLIDSAVAKWMFIDSDEQKRVSGTAYFQVEGDGGGLTLGAFHAEQGKTASWTFDSAKYYRNNTDSATRLCALIALTNSTAYTKYGVDIIGTISPGGYKRGYIFSLDFSLPLFDIGHKQTESFKTDGDRTRAGNDFSDWVAAADNTPMVIHEFKWSNITATQLLTFKAWLAAFNGNIQQPFIMVRLIDGTAPNYEMEFWRLVPQDATIELAKDKSNLYTITLTAQEQLIAF